MKRIKRFFSEFTETQMLIATFLMVLSVVGIILAIYAVITQ